MKKFFTKALPLMACFAFTSTAIAQTIDVNSADSRPSSIGSSEYFTGESIIVPLFHTTEYSNISSGEVTFPPGTRAAWHTHPAGQILVVTSGIGWVQTRGEERQEIRAGDVVRIPPDVEHWHGASAEHAMTHIAIQENVDGSGVDWMDHVTDEEYAE
ncbi:MULTISPECIES: cupin domain-containing protein [unclassified Halomonas]|uniref:(R)-mandelonitrile lyase n=1 Tax=unclassified Halomonas TaxID=2609666 RepID=UPI002076A043|nr:MULTISPECIES: cupin domain-containing protein [unclassified Halomonas]